jgi:peptidoglycan/LPS O-acetylase OafA/YrhL
MDISKNEGLQVARAMAALSVAYYHSYVAVRGFPETAAVPIYALSQWGYLGVDLFFAVSGYVICLVASKPSFSRSSFFIKRVFRLTAACRDDVYSCRNRQSETALGTLAKPLARCCW